MKKKNKKKVYWMLVEKRKRRADWPMYWVVHEGEMVAKQIAKMLHHKVVPVHITPIPKKK